MFLLRLCDIYARPATYENSGPRTHTVERHFGYHISWKPSLSLRNYSDLSWRQFGLKMPIHNAKMAVSRI